MPSASFLSAIGPGYIQGLGNLSRLDMQTLQIKEAQQRLAELRNQQAARELGGAALMMYDGGGMTMPSLDRAPPGSVVPAPMPGQPSVPQRQPQFSMGGAGGELPGAAPPMPSAPQTTLPAPGATPMPQAQPGGTGAAFAAPPPGSPSMAANGQAPASTVAAMPGRMSLRDLAQRLKAQYPNATNEQIFLAVGQMQQLLLPQERLQYTLLLNEIRQNAISQRADDRIAAQRDISNARLESQRTLQDERLRSQSEISAARNEAAMARTQAGIGGRMDALERQIQSRENEGAANRAAAQQRTQTTADASLTRQQQRFDDKLVIPIKNLDNFAANAEALAAEIEKNPTAVGAPGIVGRVVGSVYEQATGAPYDPKGENLRGKIRALQSEARTVVQGNRNYSGPANANLQQLIQGLGALDSASMSADSVRLMANRARETARIMRSELKDKSRAGPEVGDVQDGYRFKGGDPADQANWEPVQ